MGKLAGHIRSITKLIDGFDQHKWTKEGLDHNTAQLRNHLHALREECLDHMAEAGFYAWLQTSQDYFNQAIVQNGNPFEFANPRRELFSQLLLNLEPEAEVLVPGSVIKRLIDFEEELGREADVDELMTELRKLKKSA